MTVQSKASSVNQETKVGFDLINGLTLLPHQSQVGVVEVDVGQLAHTEIIEDTFLHSTDDSRFTLQKIDQPLTQVTHAPIPDNDNTDVVGTPPCPPRTHHFDAFCMPDNLEFAHFPQEPWYAQDLLEGAMFGMFESEMLKIGGGVGGAVAGGAIGSLFCPGVGTAIGALIGGLALGTGTHAVAQLEAEERVSVDWGEAISFGVVSGTTGAAGAVVATGVRATSVIGRMVVGTSRFIVGNGEYTLRGAAQAVVSASVVGVGARGMDAALSDNPEKGVGYIFNPKAMLVDAGLGLTVHGLTSYIGQRLQRIEIDTIELPPRPRIEFKPIEPPPPRPRIEFKPITPPQPNIFPLRNHPLSQLEMQTVTVNGKSYQFSSIYFNPHLSRPDTARMCIRFKMGAKSIDDIDDWIELEIELLKSSDSGFTVRSQSWMQYGNEGGPTKISAPENTNSIVSLSVNTVQTPVQSNVPQASGQHRIVSYDRSDKKIMIGAMDGQYANTVPLSTLGDNPLPALQTAHLVNGYKSQNFSTGVPRRDVEEFFGAVSQQNMAAGKLIIEDRRISPRGHHDEAKTLTDNLNWALRNEEVLIRQNIPNSHKQRVHWGVVEKVDYSLYGGSNGEPAIFIRLKKDELGEARTIVISAHEEHTIRVFR